MVLFASEIKKKDVVGSDGKIIGKVRSIAMEEKSGIITHIVVEPFDEIDVRAFTTDNEGNIIFPFEKVQSIKDMVVVSTI